MQTIPVSPAEMEQHISRFSRLRPQKAGALEQHGIPPEAYEMIAAREIFYVLGPKGVSTAVGGGVQPGAVGDPGLTVYLVRSPAGNGPMLHAHMRTREIFMPVTGRWEITWGDHGEHSTTLDPCDLIAVPRGVSRKFKNVSNAEALLLVMIQGEQGFDDVAYTPAVGEEIARRFGAPVKAAFEKTGITFNAGT
jgi:uncharacterized RmlC-like cupin family protein